MENSKQLINILVVIAALFALLFVAIQLSNNSEQREQERRAINDSETAEANIQRLPIDVLPTGLPQDLPIEKNAVVIDNSVVNSPNNGNQVIRSYRTTKTLGEVFQSYSSYLASNKWEVLGKVDNDGFKFISAKQGYKNISVNINKTPQSEETTVNVIVTW